MVEYRFQQSRNPYPPLQPKISSLRRSFIFITSILLPLPDLVLLVELALRLTVNCPFAGRSTGRDSRVILLLHIGFAEPYCRVPLACFDTWR